MTQQHRGGQDGCQRIGNALARDVRRRTVNRFIESRTTIAKGRTGQHPQRARQHRCFIGQDVSEHVSGDNHVEVSRAIDQVHGHGVDQYDVILNIGKLFGHHAGGDLSPQSAWLQNVCFVNTCQSVVATLRRFGS